MLGHGTRQQRDSNFHGHDLAVFDAIVDEFAVGGARTGLLSTEEVAGREVGEAVVADKVGALRSLWAKTREWLFPVKSRSADALPPVTAALIFSVSSHEGSRILRGSDPRPINLF